MTAEVTMPRLSDTMEEGTIVKWVKRVGEAVAVGDILAEVETDKATMELEAYDEGTLSEIRVQEGESAPVGAVIAILGGGGAVAKEEPAPAPKPEPRPTSKPKPAPEPEPAPETGETIPAATRAAEPPQPGERPMASPRARRLASERGIDLARVRGSGPGGRILEGDLGAVRRRRRRRSAAGASS
jgi:pyruvate dehydrogenase E2 component (dihydrolipoamide acetyltransferase)